MGPGAVVSGVVRFRNSSGQRLSGICVIEQEQYGIAYFSQGRTVTDRKGAYRLYALGTGSYTLMFDPGCGNNGNYLDAQRSFSIRAGQTRSGFDVFLQPGAGISGLVTDTRGRPVVGICVQIQDSQGDFGYAQTRRDGSYSIGGMTAGSYTVQFTGGCGNRPSYAPQYYNGATTSDSADAVRLTVGTVITGIDVTMQPGGTITGVVTDGRGHRLSHVCVGSVAPAQTPDGGYSDIEYTRDGSYQARNLAPGLYLVGFGCTNGYLAGQWFKSTQTVGGADLVSVNPGVITAGINAVMRPGGFISGMVTNRAGQRLANMCVLAFQRSSGLIAGYTGSIPYTDNGGRYRIGQLAQGRYDIEFFDCYNSVYGSQWYARRATQRAATGVWVRSGRITTGIGAALAVGGSISGRVVDNLGRPVGVCVTASDVATNSYAFSWSGANGYYTITGLSSGKYSVEFSACGTGEPNVGSVTSPGLVRVVAPHATRGINVRLPVGGSISGTVLGGSPTPKPQADVCVEVVPASQGGAYQYLMTTRDGAYLAANLAPGKYQVYVGDPYCPDASADFAPQWYDHQPSQSTATTVTVTAGRVTGGIGVTLLPYGGISGVVTGPSNAPVGGECVTAVPIDAVSGLLFGAAPQPEIALTGRDGSYALMSMLPGRYKVQFSAGCGASGLATQWWHGASSERAATVITVTANAVRHRHRRRPAAVRPCYPRSGRDRFGSGRDRLLEDHVDLADRLVDLPGARPAAREHRGVAGADLGRLAAVRGHRHPAGQDLHELVRLQRPVRRSWRALPDADLLVAVLPQGQRRWSASPRRWPRPADPSPQARRWRRRPGTGSPGWRRSSRSSFRCGRIIGSAGLGQLSEARSGVRVAAIGLSAALEHRTGGQVIVSLPGAWDS